MSIEERVLLYVKKPSWLRKKTMLSKDVLETKRNLKYLGLNTICQSALCPNMSECFSRGNASFLILGDHCTRNCRFCDVKHGKPKPIDMHEGKRIAVFMKENKIRYAVITSVTRDDLPDGGAKHFVRVVNDIREEIEPVTIELLIPDFLGNLDMVDLVVGSKIEVLSHNVETVPRLYKEIRPGANYNRSLRVLERARGVGRNNLIVKSGLMVGLGEDKKELDKVFHDLADVGVEILTIGQYLRPSRENIPVSRYWLPEEFVELKSIAEESGIKVVVSGPYVRSSYLADESYSKATEYLNST